MNITFAQLMVLIWVVALAVALVQASKIMVRTWASRQEHIYRQCGITHEFEKRREHDEFTHALELKRMEKHHELQKSSSNGGVGAYH